jgi:cutinase
MRISAVSWLLLAATAIAVPYNAPTPTTNIPITPTIKHVSSGNLADCKQVIMIYARGTWEPGSPPTQVAAPLIKALQAKYPGQLEAQIVIYDGGATGYLTGGDKAGTDEMERMTKAAAAKCPTSKLVLIGYR